MSQSGGENHSGDAAHSGVSGTDADEPTAQEEHTTLLSLTAELRNRIYEEALIHVDGIVVPTHGLPVQEPGLLSACRQIRAEALPMWWMGNRFDFTIDNCDATNLSLTLNRLYKIQVTNNIEIHLQPVCRVLLNGPPNWKNLLAWCERVHSVGDVTPALAPGGSDDTKLYHVASSATNLADQLSNLEVTWEGCKKALESQHATWGLLDSRWLQ